MTLWEIQEKDLLGKGISLWEKIKFTKVYISQLEILLPPKIGERVYIRILSPITLYSTFFKNGSRIIHFYRPYENEFSKLIEENAKKKLKLVHRNELPHKKSI
jgi:CRISPR-associated endoribonuclease Cas6